MTLPAGTVTFLFVDLEGSTRLLTRLGNIRYAEILSQFRFLARSETRQHGGHEVDAQGDQVFLAFPEPGSAIAAAIGVQRALAVGLWPDGTTVRARIGLHTGEPMATEAGYVGIDVHQAARICAAGHGGQILLSETTRDLVAREPHAQIELRDLGMHRLKDLTRPQRLFQVVVPGLPGDFPVLRTLDAHPNNLPVQLSSFVGRTREIAEIKARLRDTRLVTLTGPGGCGKTRLALQIAADVAEEHPDGTWLIELAPLTDPALVTAAVSATVGSVEQAGRPLIDTLTGFLSTKQALLVLDNCEHLVDACADLANRLLPKAPRVRILDTSREGLGIPGEALYPVHPLALPEPDQATQLERFLQVESVQLFRERAVAASPAFTLSQANAPAVMDICRHLDGIPLALELAASLVQAMSPQEIAERVRGQFRLRAGTSRRAVSRHQTMQAALDWSYELLSKPERRLLRRLSVFAGSWAMKAAQVICSGAGIKPADVPDLLAQLVVKSMVAVVEREGQSRYRLLETVREYARSKLLVTREAGAIHTRHLAWYADLAERLAPTEDAFADAVWGPRGQAIRAGLDDEYGNLLAALEWSVDTERADQSLHLLRVLGPFWRLGGRWEEGDIWMRKVLAAVPVTSPDRPEQEIRMAYFALLRGNLADAETLLETALRARDRTDPLYVVEALWQMAQLGWSDGDMSRVETFSRESLSVAERTGYTIGVAMAQSDLGSLAMVHGEDEQAVAWHEQSLANFRARENLGGIAMQLRKLANLLRFQGHYARAAALAEEALQTARALGSDWPISYLLGLLGQIARDRGDYEMANGAFEEALTFVRRVGDKEWIAQLLQSLAQVALDQTDFERAGSQLQAALSLQQEAGLEHAPASARTLGLLGALARYREDYDRAVTLLEQSLGIVRETGDRRALSMMLVELGAVMLHRGDHRRAKILLKESLDILKTGIWKLVLVRCVEAVGEVFEAEGSSTEAVRLLASAAQARASMGTPLPPVDQPEHNALIGRLRTNLGEAAFEAAWSEGVSTELGVAVEDVLAALEPGVAPLGSSA